MNKKRILTQHERALCPKTKERIKLYSIGGTQYTWAGCQQRSDGWGVPNTEDIAGILSTQHWVKKEQESEKWEIVEPEKCPTAIAVDGKAFNEETGKFVFLSRTTSRGPFIVLMGKQNGLLPDIPRQLPEYGSIIEAHHSQDFPSPDTPPTPPMVPNC